MTAAVAEHQGTVVKGTGDGFFVAFDDALLAVDCAISIQRALDEHRRRGGFSPAVRIGLHVGSAITAADDYSGQDVVVAARISALAGANEILMSEAAAHGLPEHIRITARGPAHLKGIPKPVEIAAIVWR